MRKSVVTILAAITLAASALTMGGCGDIITRADTRLVRDSEVRENTAYVECGMCGAHVHDWWYIHKDASDESPLVPVCQFCYQDALAEDATNN